MIREYEITQDQIDRAQLRVDELPRLNNSITQMQATLHGFTAEEVLADVANLVVVGDYGFDLKHPENGTTFELKTKRTKVAPRNYYEVSVADFNTRQQADYYAFMRVHNDLTRAWFCGVMPREEYHERSRFLKKGDVDGDNGFVVKADCWNMRIDQLYGF